MLSSSRRSSGRSSASTSAQPGSPKRSTVNVRTLTKPSPFVLASPEPTASTYQVWWRLRVSRPSESEGELERFVVVLLLQPELPRRGVGADPGAQLDGQREARAVRLLEA